MRSTLWTLVLLLVTGYGAMAQCAPSVAPDLTCSGSPLTTNININNGGNYYVNSSGTYSGINMSGGRLIICSGNVTLNSVNFNGGEIIIGPAATVTFNSGFNTGNTQKFYNYGVTTFTQSLNLGGLFYNHSSGLITVQGTASHLNNVNFINNGEVNFQELTINGGAEICLGPGSATNTTRLFNNPKNKVSVPSGFACISYKTTFEGNQPITQSPNLLICQAPGATDPVAKAVGAATVNKNCRTCEPPAGGSLPLKLTSFTGSRKGEMAELVWTTSYEEQVKGFVIEQSADGREFTAVKEVAALNRPNTYRSTLPLSGDAFFRLKMVDIDGTVTMSPIVRVQQMPASFELALGANPVRGTSTTVRVTTQQSQQGTLMLLDNSGRTLRRIPMNIQKGDNQINLDMADLIKGQYFIFFQGNKDRSKTISMLKL